MKNKNIFAILAISTFALSAQATSVLSFQDLTFSSNGQTLSDSKSSVVTEATAAYSTTTTSPATYVSRVTKLPTYQQAGTLSTYRSTSTTTTTHNATYTETDTYKVVNSTPDLSLAEQSTQLTGSILAN